MHEKAVEEVDELLKVIENELKEKIGALWRREYWWMDLSDGMGIDKKNGKNIFKMLKDSLNIYIYIYTIGNRELLE
jgi:hypothetical protein